MNPLAPVTNTGIIMAKHNRVIFLPHGRYAGIMRSAVLLASLFIILPMSGCFGESESAEIEQEMPYYPDINERQYLDWEWNGTYAMVLEKGPYTALDVQEATFEVDTSDIWETGPPTSNVHLSYYPPIPNREKRFQS
jgi:hypothetical protein